MRRHSCALAFGLLLASSACERTHELLPPVDAGDAGGGSPDAEADAAEPPYHVDAGVYLCGDKICACSDGLDNEAVPDGLPDGFDPECTGPYDNDEASFATGENKDGNPRCSDCFFDGNAGYDDGCRVPTTCVTEGLPSNAGGQCNNCVPSEECVRNCAQRTPNGCDCFGCCQIEDGMQSFTTILLTDTCSMAVLDDEKKCPPCTLNMNAATLGGPCFNPCGRCELCPGRTVDKVPDDCGDGELKYDCEDNQVCGGPNALCGNLAWCIQGCCAPLLL